MTSYEKFKQKAGEEYIDHDRFLKVRSEVFSGLSARMEKNAYEDGGIGALSEKSIHAFLKRYIEPDTDYHEVALDGFFADICRDGQITEIQTKGLGRLRKKLSVFLNYYQVTIVYPMPVNKWIGRIEKGQMQPSDFRLSPVHMNLYSAFDEIYGIKMFLKHPNLRLHLYLMDMEEIKKEAEEKHVPLCVNMVINNQNYPSVEETLEYVRNHPYIDQISINFHTPFSETEELFLAPEVRNALIDKLIDYKKRGYPIMNSCSGLRAMKMVDGVTRCTNKHCWITNFIFSDGSRSPKCMGYTHDVCDRCGFSMGGEMAAMRHYKPDTLLSGLKLRV